MKLVYLNLLLLYLLNPFIVVSQDLEGRVAKRQEQDQKVTLLLEQTTNEVDLIKSPIIRQEVLLTIAKLMWKYDQRRVPAIIEKVVNNFNKQAILDRTRPDFWEVRQFRSEIGFLISKFDPQGALNFIRETRDPELHSIILSGNIDKYKPYYNTYSLIEGEIRLEYALANEIVKQNFDLSLQIARENIIKRITTNIFELIKTIKEINVREASLLTDVVIRQLLKAEFINYRAEWQVADSLLKLLSQDLKTGKPESQQLMLNSANLRLLITKFVNWYLKAEPLGGNFHLIPELLPIIEKLSPSEAKLLLPKLEESKQNQERLFGKTPEEKRLSSLSPEQLFAEKTDLPSEKLKTIYSNALNGLVENYTELARRLVNTVSDSKMRNYLKDRLDEFIFGEAIAKGNLTKAVSVFPKNSDQFRRFSNYERLYQYAEIKKDEKLADEMLTNMRRLVNFSPQNKSETQLLFRYANSRMKTSPGETFKIFESAIERFQNLFDSETKLQQYFRDPNSQLLDETKMSDFRDRLQSYGLAFPLNQLLEIDFDRTVGLADLFERPEQKIFMRLLIIETNLRDRFENATG